MLIRFLKWRQSYIDNHFKRKIKIKPENSTCGHLEESLILKLIPAVVVVGSGQLGVSLLNCRADRFLDVLNRESRWYWAPDSGCSSGKMTASKDPTKKKPKDPQQDEVPRKYPVLFRFTGAPVICTVYKDRILLQAFTALLTTFLTTKTHWTRIYLIFLYVCI